MTLEGTGQPHLSTREEMELFLDYEIRNSLFHWLINGPLEWLYPLTGRYYAWKVGRKYKRYLRRSSVIDAIVAERGPYFGFHG